VIIRHEPTPIEKKACPTAARKVLNVTLLKSGCSKNVTVLAASPLASANPTMPTRRRKKSGIKMVAARSIPPLTPRATINVFTAIKPPRHHNIMPRFPIVSPKFAPELAAVKPSKVPEYACGMKAMTQAEITM